MTSLDFDVLADVGPKSKIMLQTNISLKSEYHVSENHQSKPKTIFQQIECVAMVLFQDEPEERDVRKPPPGPSAKRSSLFGSEPEERPGAGKSQRTSPGRSYSLFGEEREETGVNEPRFSSGGSSGSRSPPQQQVNVDWTTMQLFSQATFLKKAVEVSEKKQPKRPYDNTNRIQNAAPTDKKSFKDMALDPSRLISLKKQPFCKCILVQMVRNFFMCKKMGAITILVGPIFWVFFLAEYPYHQNEPRCPQGLLQLC